MAAEGYAIAAHDQRMVNCPGPLSSDVQTKVWVWK
jgi:hypothetical protein